MDPILLEHHDAAHAAFESAATVEGRVEAARRHARIVEALEADGVAHGGRGDDALDAVEDVEAFATAEVDRRLGEASAALRARKVRRADRSAVKAAARLRLSEGRWTVDQAVRLAMRDVGDDREAVRLVAGLVVEAMGLPDVDDGEPADEPEEAAPREAIGDLPPLDLATAPDAAVALARRFHESYERLAPLFGYKTREESSVPWDDVPDANKRLMIAVAGEILAGGVAPGEKTDAGRAASDEQGTT